MSALDDARCESVRAAWVGGDVDKAKLALYTQYHPVEKIIIPEFEAW